MILNQTPIITSKNYKINNIELDLEFPKKIEEFNGLTILGDTSNFKISNDVSKTPLIYGNGIDLENQIFEKGNQNIKIEETKTGSLYLEFNLNEENPVLVENTEIDANTKSKTTIYIKYMSDDNFECFHNGAIRVNAKANSEYYTKMVPLCREANIIMLLINHITTDINTGFLPKKSELPYLKQGEHISGGKSLTYIQNNIFRLDIKSKLKEEEGMGIHGSIVNIDIVKSRTNISSRANCFLVFDQKNGYDSDLSLLLLLKENKILEGTGAYLKLPGYDKKFSQKQFKEVLYSDPEFYKVFVSLCIQCLQSNLLNDYNKIKQEEEMLNNNMKPYEMIISQINS